MAKMRGEQQASMLSLHPTIQFAKALICVMLLSLQMAKTCIARRAAQTQVIDQQTEPDRAAEIERMQQLLIKQEADEQQQTLRKVFPPTFCFHDSLL